MQTQKKLVALELIGGIFGWVWILASLAAVYFLIAALAFGGQWSFFFGALGCGIVCKWLARGFNDSKNRVGYEAELMARGLSKEAAGKAWVEAYSGGTDALAELMRLEDAANERARRSAGSGTDATTCP